jgi:hypothetical protein
LILLLHQWPKTPPGRDGRQGKNGEDLLLTIGEAVDSAFEGEFFAGFAFFPVDGKMPD